MRGNIARRSFTGFVFVVFGLLSLQFSAWAQTPTAKLEELIKNSGYASTKVGDNAWTIDFTGKQLPRFKMILTASGKDKDGVVVILANPAEKSRLPITTTFLMLLLKANHDFDYVKVGTDGDGDVFVRADIPDSADGAYFKRIVEQVAAATDQLYGRIKPFLRN